MRLKIAYLDDAKIIFSNNATMPVNIQGEKA
jgi:hypothetical protein